VPPGLVNHESHRLRGTGSLGFKHWTNEADGAAQICGLLQKQQSVRSPLTGVWDRHVIDQRLCSPMVHAEQKALVRPNRESGRVVDLEPQLFRMTLISVRAGSPEARCVRYQSAAAILRQT
jgi:hypothetical protein